MLEQVHLPPQIKQCMSVFKQYYMSKFNGRQLNWKLNQGFAEMRARIGNGGKKKYEMSVSTYQMCILMLFNEQPRLSYHELLQNIQVSDSELKSHLIPLCQFKFLQKSPVGKEFKMDDSFKVNLQYSNSNIKIKVPVMHSKTQKNAENNELQKRVEDDRKHIIDATLVKVMKSRRRLDLNSLIADSVKILQNKFSPEVGSIQLRIEHLIEREYLERDKEDRRMFNYLA
mmetsp:Transcript_4322/g.7299  ORF Transcript_4322/g.7299 Transcript_4322/m.7299 type:complete len:228 (-) Transcript_4322:35-718(-)